MKVLFLRRVIHPNPSAFKRKSGITGLRLRSFLFRFSFDSSRNRMWGRKCPGEKTNWILFFQCCLKIGFQNYAAAIASKVSHCFG